MATVNFAGIASGIDTNALIDATVAARRAQNVTPKSDKVQTLTDTNDALTTLKTKLSDLQTKIREFTTLNGGGLAKIARSSDETIITATAANAASNGTYTITPTQLAQNGTYAFKSTAGTYSSSDAVIGSTIVGTGTVQIDIGTGTELQTVTLNVDNTTTLSQFATNFNNSTSKATASVINVGTSASPDYRLVINSLNEGTLKGSLSVTVSAAITGASAFNNNSSSAAQNATFTVGGIGGGGGDVITRYSNSFSDVIPGVTVTLQNTSSTGISVSVGDDADATAAKIQDWVTAYNDIIAFIAENDAVTRQQDGNDVTNIFNPLASTSVDESMLSSIRGVISSAVYSTGTQVRVLADLGVTTERDGTLKFDSTVLTQAVANESASAKQLLKNFADTVSLTGGTIDQYIRFNGIFDITINGNKDLITNLNDQIGRAEAAIAKEKESLTARFARLEALIGRMQGQQSQLTSALAGLS